MPAFRNNLDRPAAPQRNHRLSAGQRLDHSDAKVLLAGHQRRTATRIQLAQFFIRLSRMAVRQSRARAYFKLAD